MPYTYAGFSYLNMLVGEIALLHCMCVQKAKFITKDIKHARYTKDSVLIIYTVVPYHEFFQCNEQSK